MNDPFFDEDDGEFDDLYGNPRPSASAPATKQIPRNTETPSAQPVTPGGRLSIRSPAASSSVVSRSYVRDRAGSTASNITDLAASGKQDTRRKKHGKMRRKGSQELFDVQWESDKKTTKCGLCRSDFSLVRRKHHCRHCGRLVCSDCSVFLYFEFSQRKHRVCVMCNNQLLKEQDAYDRETLAGRSQVNLFDNLSEDGKPPSVTPASTTGDAECNNGVDEKANMKQEKKERKDRKKREKGEKMNEQKTEQVAAMTVKQSLEKNPSTNGAALFDGGDDDWFTDVPDQRERSRNSGDDYSDNGGSKGPGWRDHVKDTYSVTAATEQTSVLVPMAGSTLTAGITGKGYISDQFRYDDVGGPGLGHDDDFSVEMPRPKQESASATYADHSAKPSRLTVNGYFSEQFQYDDVAGPGLGHDDDHSVAMPRPKQQPMATPFSYESERAIERQSEHDPDDSSSPNQDFEPRQTFKDNLKDMFSSTKRRESTTKRRDKRGKSSEPRARGNENMTLDELNPSYSSEDEPRAFTSAMPRPTTLTTTQSTFYDNNADKLVVDDSPGFFETTIAEREAQHKLEEEQKQQLASDMAWVNSSALPPTVPAHRFSSEQESYSIVDPPSHTSNSPVERRGDGSTAGDAAGNAKGGFTGALKRFFGMGSRSTGKRATTPPKIAKAPSTPVANAAEKDSADKQSSAIPDNTHSDNVIVAEPASTGLERHTVLAYYGATREGVTPPDSFRYTVAGHIDSDANPRLETPAPAPIIGSRKDSVEVQQKTERKRRGTFDDLFESPNSGAVRSAERYSTTGASDWATRVGGNSAANRASYAATAVGVARFDRRRSIDEADDCTLGDEPRPVLPPERTVNNSTEAWRQSAAMSLLDDRKNSTPKEGSGFTWNNMRSAPDFGTATYAVPTSLQPHAIYEDNRDSSFQYDTPAPLGNIMDELKRGSMSKKAQDSETVDDIFAEFEEPNDYVFDPATGGYVAARLPPRAAAIYRHVTQSEATDLSPSQQFDKPAHRSSERDYTAPSGLVARSTALMGASKDGSGEEVEDEVAEIIVDKISSLENELAALKQLIRNRKGSGGNDKPRTSHNFVKPNVRKESIFDNDSSDEENGKPINPHASSVRPVSVRKSKRRPSSKRVKKRKDSFADLFEDSPNEKETFGGARSYEDLFQTGTNVSGINKEAYDEDSDDDAGFNPKPARARASKSRRRSSRKINGFLPSKDGSDSEPEFTSLQGRRGKSSSRRNAHEDVGAATVNMASSKADGEVAMLPSVDVIPVKKQVEVEEDPIDALFDTSDEHDVTKLYGGDLGRNGEQEDFAQESKPTPKTDSSLFTQASSTSLTGEEIASTTADGVVPVDKSTSSFSNSLDVQNLNESDGEEDFSINWTKIRKTKSRRHRSLQSSSSPSKIIDKSIVTENAAENLLLEPKLLETSSEHALGVNDTPAASDEIQTSVPSTFLADAASNWMSVSTLEDEAVNLSLTGDEDLNSLLQSANEREDVQSTADTVETAVTAITNKDKNLDHSNAASVSVSMDHHTPVEEILPNSGFNDVILAGESDGSEENPSLSNVKSVDKPSGMANAKDAKQKDATFDIFDKSGDVDFLSVNSSMQPFEHGGDGSDTENDDKESLQGDDEAFSFEVQPPKKRSSALDLLATTSSALDLINSSPPSPVSSEDDNVELGKYATPSVQPSSRTPSVDGSLNDSEDASVDNEPILGKVEAQTFDTDWQQMQATEKERKKRLQVKQRQAQRDKVLRKQGVSSKSLSGSAPTHGSSKGKSKSGKKKKKEKDDTTASSSHHKKSGSSRKHRHHERGDATGPSEPPRSLTEL